MAKNNNKIQSLIFEQKHFYNKSLIKDWIGKNGFKIDTRLKKPILKCNDTFRVRQRNPDVFNKQTFKCESLGKGVKGVYGVLKSKR